MAIISANLQFNRGGHGLLDYSSLQKNYSTALAWAQDVNSNAAVGQFIYLEEAETIGDVEYAKGPYVVDAIGEGAVLTPLSKSVAGGEDLAGAVSDLKSEVGTLKSSISTTDASVKALETTVDAIDETYATKAELETAIGNVDFSALATKEELANGLADKADASNVYTKDEVDAELAKKLEADDIANLASKTELSEGLAEKADASNVYTKEEADGKFVVKEGYVAFSQDEKDKLAGIAEGAEVNYIKSVGDNLSVDENGKLEVSIPEVEVPFQSVAEGDKVLKLENGVLSSTLSYAREAVEGVDSLVLKGIDGDVIGSVPVADFIADGMLESVTPVEDTNKFKFTFKKVDGSTEDFEVDFGKFVDVYHGDDATIVLNSENNTFSVKDNVFDAHGAAAAAEQNAKDYADGKFQVAGNYEEAGAAAEVEGKFNEYVTSNNAAVAAKVDSSDYDSKMTEIDGSISSINNELANKANAADVYTSTKVDELLGAKVDSSDYDAKVAEIDGSISSINTELANKAVASEVENALNGKVDKVEGSSLVSDELITKLDNMAEIKSVGGDLTFTDGALSLDLSEYAKSGDVANTYVTKEEGKGLSTNDFTNDLKTKLDGIAEGAEVNYVKSVGANLAVDGAGNLTVDLSAYATSEALTNGLVAKLDATAKVNGVSFVDGEATLTAGNIALEGAITRTGEDGAVENVYTAETSIQSVLASLSNRIDILDPNVSGELGITSIVEGNGIKVETSGGQATISVKASEVEGNMAEVKTDGVYVADMRSYWQAI